MNNSSDLLILQFLHHERKVWSSLFIYNRTKCYCVHVFDLPGSQLSDIENHLLSFISCFKGWFLYLPITFFHFTKCVQHKITASTAQVLGTETDCKINNLSTTILNSNHFTFLITIRQYCSKQQQRERERKRCP